MTEERRKTPRIELRFKITINIRHKGIHEVKDLSVGGLFIRTTDPSMFGQGDEIELVMQLPVEDTPTSLNARVCHAGEDGIDVEFFDVKPEDEKALEYCFSLAFLVSPVPYLIEKTQKAGMGSEKRRDPRIDIQLPVEVATEQEEPQMVKDLSVGGLFLETVDPSQFQAGDEIELVMREPADNKLMRLNARVAHVGKNGIGVEFFNVTAEDQKALRTCFDLFRYTWPKIDG